MNALTHCPTCGADLSRGYWQHEQTLERACSVCLELAGPMSPSVVDGERVTRGMWVYVRRAAA